VKLLKECCTRLVECISDLMNKHGEKKVIVVGLIIVIVLFGIIGGAL